MNNIGFRILPIGSRVEASMLKLFENMPTPLLSDNMNRLQGASYMLRPYHKSQKIIGSAFTVKTRSGDNLMVHKAIDLAEPGDVIVVDAGGESRQAILGEIMLRLASQKKLAGFVVDGMIRDSAAFKEHDFPCFAKGVTHRGPFKEGPGEINTPVTVGEMIVHPGDIIVGDEDGLVSISPEYAEEIFRKSSEQQAKELKVFETISNNTVDRNWIDKTLHQKGCTLSES